MSSDIHFHGVSQTSLTFTLEAHTILCENFTDAQTLKLNKNYPQLTKGSMEFTSIITEKLAKTSEICFAKQIQVYMDGGSLLAY